MEREVSPAVVAGAVVVLVGVLGVLAWYLITAKSERPRNAILAPPPPTFSLDPGRGGPQPAAPGGFRR